MEGQGKAAASWRTPLSLAGSPVPSHSLTLCALATVRGLAQVSLVKPLLVPYMLPLFLVYLSEYMINQGLYEHIVWEDEFISKPTQYRVYQTLYQFGVFFSRSSVNILPVKRIWVPAALQVQLRVLHVPSGRRLQRHGKRPTAISHEYPPLGNPPVPPRAAGDKFRHSRR